MGVWKQTATKSKGDGEGYERPPAGNHPAVLVAIVDMGTQTQKFGASRRAYFLWELVTEKVAGTSGNNHLIGIDLNVSLNEKAKLRLWIEARCGKKMPEGTEYDILKELGQKCLLDVIENKSGYPVVNGMKAVPKGYVLPPAQHEPFSWSLDDYAKDGTVRLPQWVEDVWLYGEPISGHIRKSKELTNPDPGEAAEPHDAAGPADERDDDPLPF